MSTLLIVIVVAAAALLLFVALPLIYVKNYIKVPPNEVAVFTGRGTPKVVRGGARFRMPGIERVDIMSLEPFNVSINLQNALSNNGVPVNVEAVGLVRIGSADEAVQTAVQRFLTSDLNELQRQINEILAGSLRGITATMTVEDLNSNRDSLARSVVEEAGGDLARIGMEVDVLKIAGISDANDYLKSLGQRRIAAGMLLDLGFQLAGAPFVIQIRLTCRARTQRNHGIIGSRGFRRLAPFHRRTLASRPRSQYRSQPEQDNNGHHDHNESGQIEKIVHQCTFA